MLKESAGLIMYRRGKHGLEVLLVHPGGPYWAHKDDGVWSIPKGEYEGNEDPLAAAKREFSEETGITPSGDFTPLRPLRQKSGKVITAWAFEGDCDASKTHSNIFTMEWPPHSGKQAQFPEVDRAAWFSPPEARRKLSPGQIPFLDELLLLLEKSWQS